MLQRIKKQLGPEKGFKGLFEAAILHTLFVSFIFIMCVMFSVVEFISAGKMKNE